MIIKPRKTLLCLGLIFCLSSCTTKNSMEMGRLKLLNTDQVNFTEIGTVGLQKQIYPISNTARMIGLNYLQKKYALTSGWNTLLKNETIPTSSNCSIPITAMLGELTQWNTLDTPPSSAVFFTNPTASIFPSNNSPSPATISFNQKCLQQTLYSSSNTLNKNTGIEQWINFNSEGEFKNIMPQQDSAKLTISIPSFYSNWHGTAFLVSKKDIFSNFKTNKLIDAVHIQQQVNYTENNDLLEVYVDLNNNFQLHIIMPKKYLKSTDFITAIKTHLTQPTNSKSKPLNTELILPVINLKQIISEPEELQLNKIAFTETGLYYSKFLAQEKKIISDSPSYSPLMKNWKKLAIGKPFYFEIIEKNMNLPILQGKIDTIT